MKVIVGKMPGGRATSIEVPTGSTVQEVVAAAGYSSDLNNGYEARLNNQQVALSTIVPENAIVALTAKITGNSAALISVLPIVLDANLHNAILPESIIIDAPISINEALSYDTVKECVDHISELSNDGLLPVWCSVVSKNGEASRPLPIVTSYLPYIVVDNDARMFDGDTLVLFNSSMLSNFLLTTNEERRRQIDSFLRDYEDCDNADEVSEDENIDVVHDETQCCCNNNCNYEQITLESLAKTAGNLGLSITVSFDAERIRAFSDLFND